MIGKLLSQVVSVKVDKETHDRLKAVAMSEQKSVATFLRDQIEVAVHMRDAPLLAPRRLEPWRSL